MEPLSPFPIHDPELDPPRPRRPAPAPTPHLPQEYQRLVANPFLAAVGLLVWFVVMEQALSTRNLYLVGLALLGLVGVAYLLHYHCLDCGSTGLLFRWKLHACERVLARQQTNQVRRFRGPNPVYQTVLWIYVMAGVAILVAVVLRAMHS